MTKAQALARTRAQNTESLELLQLRQQAQQQALLKSATLTDQFIKALSSLEQEAAAKGDYEQALAAQERRYSLSQVQALTNQSNALILKPSTASRFVGAVSYDHDTDTLLPWRSVGSSASWEINKITPGNYDITIVYSVAPLGEMRAVSNYSPYTGGQFEFFEDSSLPGAAQNRRSASVASTGGWKEFSTLQIGPSLQLSRSNARFTLRITRTNGDGGVMHLKEIRLTPAIETRSLAIDTPSDPFGTLQASYQQKIKELTTPTIQAYLQSLNSLLTEATANKQTETVNELNAEIQRAQQWLERPQIKPQSPSNVSLFENSDEEWNNVRFVNNSANTGDRFYVEHNGVKVLIQLKSVTCPPPSADAIGELQHFAAYFQISPEDALSIGREARTFTANMLKNKPLRLRTNGQKNRDGHLLATIILPHLGDYSGILIDNGLASINPPPKTRHEASTSPHVLAARQTFLALQQRENVARNRTPSPGAWAFSDAPKQDNDSPTQPKSTTSTENSSLNAQP